MNFFDHQDRARRNTVLLALYFLLAVIAVVGCVSMMVFLAVFWMSGATLSLSEWWRSPACYITVALTLSIILAGSARKFWQLRNGGEALVEMLGAREVPLDTNQHNERVYRNVVEEMAIASGIPAPRTYVLEQEHSVNAFVAGFRPTEVVVCVTKGALEQLDRNELQGVLAHEFSHIFNADMKINLRLLAVLAGIMGIGKLGEFLLRSNTRRHYNHHTGRDEAVGHFALILLGMALMIIGYAGLFVGRLIKAAISRQRELLADASAVQFTRNPSGIAGALIKIHNGAGTVLSTSHAEDMSHMCFGETLPLFLRGFLSTHPPVQARLNAIGPGWLARARVRKRTEEQPAPTTQPQGSTDQSQNFATAVMGAAALVGTIGATHMQRGRDLQAAMPASLLSQLHQPEPAQWVMFALAINASQSPSSELIPALGLSGLEQRVLAQTCAQLDGLDKKLRLPIIDLAIPTLKHLPQAQRDTFLEKLDALVAADQRMTPFEFVLTRILADHLGSRSQRANRIRFRRFQSVRHDIRVLCSLLTHVSGACGRDAEKVFRSATDGMLGDGETTQLLPATDCKLPAIERALQRLAQSTPTIKSALINALADLVMADGDVRAGEQELMRAICMLLDCPVPPLSGTT